ncbi:hypothetical protein [Salinibacter grassmerensis]|uniref:hypothetical protein n=1 Tax=Salinibacter grassmerensis TaxID=3040353 RepID=UPI0021E969C1|nr:hypothetical protein [Salinibacter grassmerensis]
MSRASIVPPQVSIRCAAVLLLAAVLLGGCTSTASDAEAPPETLSALVSSYEARLAGDLEEGLPFRDDGYAYAVDLGNTMSAAVALGNRSLFDRAYGMVRAHFLRAGAKDPRARHTVLWRYKPGTTPDASGSKETGILADALWDAYERWGSDEYRRMAVKVLDAYLRHGYWEADRRFVIKNYYNYGTQTLSESTWVLNQMPHTVRKIACGTQDSSLFRHASAMAQFTEEAYLKKGFSREMYDKGIETVFDGTSGYYSPNGLVKLQSSLEIARALLPFDPAPAREVVEFIGERYPDVSPSYYYNPRSEEIAPLAKTSEQAYGLSEKALVLLLATRLSDSFGEAFLRDFVEREIVPDLQDRRDEMFSTFYFDVPLMLKAAERYLQPGEGPAPSGESECKL